MTNEINYELFDTSTPKDPEPYWIREAETFLTNHYGASDPELHKAWWIIKHFLDEYWASRMETDDEDQF